MIITSCIVTTIKSDTTPLCPTFLGSAPRKAAVSEFPAQPDYVIQVHLPTSQYRSRFRLLEPKWSQLYRTFTADESGLPTAGVTRPSIAIAHKHAEDIFSLLDEADDLAIFTRPT